MTQISLPLIDMEQTGRRIKRLCIGNGYTVRQLQQFLGIGAPQSIYNWFYGKTLPSLDHLYALSALLHVPMNWLLVTEKFAFQKEQLRGCEKIPQLYRLDRYQSWCQSRFKTAVNERKNLYDSKTFM